MSNSADNSTTGAMAADYCPLASRDQTVESIGSASVTQMTGQSADRVAAHRPAFLPRLWRFTIATATYVAMLWLLNRLAYPLDSWLDSFQIWPPSIFRKLQLTCGLAMFAAALFHARPEQHLHWLGVVWIIGCYDVMKAIFVMTAIFSNPWRSPDPFETFWTAVPGCVALPLGITNITWITVGSFLLPRDRGHKRILGAVAISMFCMTLIAVWIFCDPEHWDIAYWRSVY